MSAPTKTASSRAPNPNTGNVWFGTNRHAGFHFCGCIGWKLWWNLQYVCNTFYIKPAPALLTCHQLWITLTQWTLKCSQSSVFVVGYNSWWAGESLRARSEWSERTRKAPFTQTKQWPRCCCHGEKLHLTALALKSTSAPYFFHNLFSLKHSSSVFTPKFQNTVKTVKTRDELGENCMTLFINRFWHIWAFMDIVKILQPKKKTL